MIGLAMAQVTLMSFVFAQNETSTSSPIVVSVDKLVYSAIIPLALSILAILQGFAQNGRFGKRTSDALIMAADATRAVADTRQAVNKYANATYEVIKLAAPEVTEKADKLIAPEIDNIANKVKEYQPKVDAFASIASASSNSGQKASNSMKALKDQIPNNIVPSSSS